MDDWVEYKVNSKEYRLTDKILNTDLRLGDVYKCLDKDNEERLIHITTVSSEDIVAIKFYTEEAKHYVGLVLK